MLAGPGTERRGAMHALGTGNRPVVPWGCCLSQPPPLCLEVAQFSDLNCRSAPLAPARTPDWSFFLANLGNMPTF